MNTLLEKNYLKLWFSQLISYVFDWVYYTALVVIVFKSHHPSSLAWLALTYTLPTVLLAPFLGVFPDLFDRKKGLVLCCMLRAALLIPLFFTQNLYVILLLMFLENIFSITSYILNKAILTGVVPNKELLVKANAWLVVAKTSAKAVGAFIGAVLIIHFSLSVVVIVNMISFGVSAFLFNALDYKHQVFSKPKSLSFLGNYKQDLIAGFKTLKATPVVFYNIILFSVSMVIGNSLNAYLIAFIKGVYGKPDALFGVFTFTAGVALVLAGLVFSMSSKLAGNLRSPDKFYYLFFIYIAVAFAFTFIHVLPISLVLIFIFAFLGVWLRVFNNTCIQLYVPNEFQGRVFGLSNATWNMSVVITTLVCGMLMDHVEIITLYCLLSAFTLFAGVLVTLSMLSNKRSNKLLIERG